MSISPQPDNITAKSVIDIDVLMDQEDETKPYIEDKLEKEKQQTYHIQVPPKDFGMLLNSEMMIYKEQFRSSQISNLPEPHIHN